MKSVHDVLNHDKYLTKNAKFARLSSENKKQIKKIKKRGKIKMADVSKLALLKQILENAENSINSAKHLIAELGGRKINKDKNLKEKAKSLQIDPKGEIVEGIFDGQNMICPDGHKYPVQPNYASKSKLIPGDKLKLVIQDDGSFIFKQIGLIDRKRIIGTLIEDEENFKVLANGKPYGVLTASVTYFKAKPKDEVTLLVPEKEESDWGAIENVIVKPSH